MSQPETPRFTCIGCGASVPVGSDVCPGCQHRFAGPDPGPPVGRRSASSGPPPDPRAPIELALGGFGRFVGTLVLGPAILLSAAIAFVTVCTATSPALGEATNLGLALGGLAALAVVVGLGTFVRAVFRPRSTRRARKP